MLSEFLDIINFALPPVILYCFKRVTSFYANTLKIARFMAVPKLISKTKKIRSSQTLLIRLWIVIPWFYLFYPEVPF